MTTIWNDPARFREDMVAGFLAAYGRYVEQVPGTSGVMRAGGATKGKVSVIIGGGSGHYPAFCGTVGPGFADGAVIGDVFTSPSTEQAYRVGKALNGGAGVLFSYGNYAGDVLNFDAAQERLRAEGIDCRTVLVTDDVASASVDEKQKRRGIAGDVPVFKVMSAAADQGRSIDEVERIGNAANDVTRTFGVAFAGCTLPGETEPLFSVDAGKMELGLGIHGEPGIQSVERGSASDLAKMLVDPLLAERPDGAGRAAVFLNGLGATKYEELFVLWGTISRLLGEASVEIVMPEVGELVSSLDMAGCSLTVTWLDEELEELWVAPADTPAFRRGDASSLQSSGERVDAHAQLESVDEEMGDATPESEAAAERVRVALRTLRETVEANETELGRLDSVAGDGDHGTGMVRGARAAESAAEAAGGAGTVLRRAGEAFGDKAGGTSGMLWGAMLIEFGKALGDQEAASPEAVVRAVRAATDEVKRLGKSDVGDKTLLDALIPFADALEANVGEGRELAAAWAAAAEKADEGAKSTTDMRPRVGRARPLAERSVGNPDPGAVSMALSLAAIGRTIGQG